MSEVRKTSPSQTYVSRAASPCLIRMSMGRAAHDTEHGQSAMSPSLTAKMLVPPWYNAAVAQISPKPALNVIITLAVAGAVGFIVPLTFSRRITAIGLVVCLGG